MPAVPAVPATTCHFAPGASLPGERIPARGRHLAPGVCALALMLTPALAAGDPTPSAPGPPPPPAATAAGGFVKGNPSSRYQVVVYLDYSCPTCRLLLEQNGPTLDRAVAAGLASVEYRPLALPGPGQSYAIAAGAALACAAGDGVDLSRYSRVLADAAPQQGAPDPDLSFLAAAAAAAASGAGPEVRRCVTSGRYASWVLAATRAAAHPRTGADRAAPDLLVNGRRLDVSSAETLAQRLEVPARSSV